jgi:hypothetical protein
LNQQVAGDDSVPLAPEVSDSSADTTKVEIGHPWWGIARGEAPLDDQGLHVSQVA